MRILVLNERDLRNPLAGGAEVHVFEIFSRLVKRGHEVTLLAASFPGGSREENVRGLRVRRLSNRYLYYGLVGLAARREAKQGGYDIVVDVLNKLPFLSPWLVGRPQLAIVHHLFGTTAFGQVAFPIALTTWLSEKLIPSAYRGVVMLAISPSTKADLVGRGLAADRVWVVPPGLDHEVYRPGPPQSERERIVLWVGRLEPYKRADVLIDAMTVVRAKLPEASLLIIGEGSARRRLERQARRLGLGDVVTFSGFVGEAEKIVQLQRAAVVVNTSEKEGWGMTAIEGNACGTPSVAADVAGLRDSVRDGETGLLVDHADAGALASALLQVLTDADLCERLVSNGIRWAQRFSWEQAADSTERLIEEAINPGGEKPCLAASPFDR